MFVLAVGSKLITHSPQNCNVPAGRTCLRSLSPDFQKQIEDVGLRQPKKYIGFLGTLFLFVALASLRHSRLRAADGSLSTTAALALCVLVAVPFFGIEEQGLAVT